MIYYYQRPKNFSSTKWLKNKNPLSKLLSTQLLATRCTRFFVWRKSCAFIILCRRISMSNCVNFFRQLPGRRHFIMSQCCRWPPFTNWNVSAAVESKWGTTKPQPQRVAALFPRLSLTPARCIMLNKSPTKNVQKNGRFWLCYPVLTTCVSLGMIETKDRCQALSSVQGIA